MAGFVSALFRTIAEYVVLIATRLNILSNIVFIRNTSTVLEGNLGIFQSFCF